jgi:hypothetical protein
MTSSGSSTPAFLAGPSGLNGCAGLPRVQTLSRGYAPPATPMMISLDRVARRSAYWPPRIPLTLAWRSIALPGRVHGPCCRRHPSPHPQPRSRVLARGRVEVREQTSRNAERPPGRCGAQELAADQRWTPVRSPGVSTDPAGGTARYNVTFLVGMPPGGPALSRHADGRGAWRSQMRRGESEADDVAKCVAPCALLAQSFPGVTVAENGVRQ